MRAEEITIAVTVYDRRQFLAESIHSALTQSKPVKVIVVEDCSPDVGLRDWVLGQFGSRIEYLRNRRNRGLFDNWNACLEYCRTPWISILHDDDILRPNFVEAVIDLAGIAPNRALYFGRAAYQREDTIWQEPMPNWQAGWRDFDLVEMADVSPVIFPGQLIDVEKARAIGGFKKESYFTGDWDMWFRLALHFGGAQTATEVAVGRSHIGDSRGTTLVERKGWKWALDNVQRKRNLALLRQIKGISVPFDRAKPFKKSPIPSRVLLEYANRFTWRILHYNAWLLVNSKAPNARYSALQWLVRLVGPGALRMSSALRLVTRKPS